MLAWFHDVLRHCHTGRLQEFEKYIKVGSCHANRKRENHPSQHIKTSKQESKATFKVSHIIYSFFTSSNPEKAHQTTLLLKTTKTPTATMTIKTFTSSLLHQLTPISAEESAQLAPSRVFDAPLRRPLFQKAKQGNEMTLAAQRQQRRRESSESTSTATSSRKDSGVGKLPKAVPFRYGL